MDVHAPRGSSPLDRELRGSPVRSVIADEPALPVVAPRPLHSLSEGSQGLIEDLDDIRGDATAWRRLWLADKFKFRIPLRFHEIMEPIKGALKFPGEPEAAAPTPQAQAQARSLFVGVPPVAPTQRIVMPWDTMCAAKRDSKGLLDGTSKTLGEGVFARKFPAANADEKSFLTPQTIDPEAEKHFRVWVKKDFAATKPFGSDTSSVLASAEKLSVRLDERLATVNRLSSLLIQVQAYIHHAAVFQAAALQRLREDAATPALSTDPDFDPAVVADAMEFAAYLTACISRITIHIQAEVRLDRRSRLVNHLRPDGGLPGIPSFTKRKLLELPLDSELLFAGQFDQVLKDTTSTKAIAFQTSQIAAGSPPLDLSGSFKIPKRPAQTKSQGPAKKRRRGRSLVQPQHQQQHQQQQQVAQPQAQEKPQQQRSGYNSSGSRGRGRGRAGPGPNEVEPGPVGGRLRGFVGAWGDITSDKWVLQTVSSGYRIEFTERSVGRFLKFAGRLLSHSCRSKRHEVSPLRLRRRDLRVSGPAVRPVDRSQNLYASGQSGRSLSQDAGNKCFPVS